MFLFHLMQGGASITWCSWIPNNHYDHQWIIHNRRAPCSLEWAHSAIVPHL